jgi:hypothetical protein
MKEIKKIITVAKQFVKMLFSIYNQEIEYLEALDKISVVGGKTYTIADVAQVKRYLNKNIAIFGHDYWVYVTPPGIYYIVYGEEHKEFLSILPLIRDLSFHGYNIFEDMRK